MRGHSSLRGLLVLLLALGVCGLGVPPPRGHSTPSPPHTSSPAGTSPAPSDLDGDGLADPVLFSPGNPHHIELYLSRTDERIALPVSAVAGGGSLSAQDLDGDGDMDLLWQGSLPTHTVRVWLNDGVGRFECLCPPASRERRWALSGPGLDAAPARPPASAL
ncbi:MAG TPA: FG-GAP-like repeat-containing protein, partial [Candidatus Binatia bacterium]|nr:FG-GAP-like repeat-containing protein [Candidatus Binatia bacterium]